MINTLKIYEELQEAMAPEAAQRIAKVMGTIYEDLQSTVSKKEFGELTAVVQELAEAQKRTALKVEELAEAQTRTALKVEEMAEAQTRTALKVEELAEAQTRTALKVEEWAEAQTRIVLKVEKLAEAQRKTELELQTLVKSIGRLDRAQQETQKELGGVSTSVGHRLEDISYKALPKLLKRDYGLSIKGGLRREYVKGKTGQFIEINISGKARRNDKEITIAGESKSRLSRKGVDEFLRKKVQRIAGVYPNLFPVMITYMIADHNVENYAKQKGVALYYSYDF